MYFKLLFTDNTPATIVVNSNEHYRIALSKVSGFYDSAWNKLIITAGLFGIVLPLLITWYQSQNFRKEILEMRKNLQAQLIKQKDSHEKYIDRKSEVYEKKLNDHSKEYMDKLDTYSAINEQKLQDSIDSFEEKTKNLAQEYEDKNISIQSKTKDEIEKYASHHKQEILKATIQLKTCIRLNKISSDCILHSHEIQRKGEFTPDNIITKFNIDPTTINDEPAIMSMKISLTIESMSLCFNALSILSNSIALSYPDKPDKQLSIAIKLIDRCFNIFNDHPNYILHIGNITRTTDLYIDNACLIINLIKGNSEYKDVSKILFQSTVRLKPYLKEENTQLKKLETLYGNEIKNPKPNV
jgi:hypothetical protein